MMMDFTAEEKIIIKKYTGEDARVPGNRSMRTGQGVIIGSIGGNLPAMLILDTFTGGAISLLIGGTMIGAALILQGKEEESDFLNYEWTNSAGQRVRSPAIVADAMQIIDEKLKTEQAKLLKETDLQKKDMLEAGIKTLFNDSAVLEKAVTILPARPAYRRSM